MKTNSTNLPDKQSRDVTMIPPVSGFKLGDKTTYNGVNYTAGKLFPQGRVAHDSNYNYFMLTARGVFGMREI